MSNFKLGPKVQSLGDDESLASIERWKQNIIYHLRLNEEFRPFLTIEFGKKSRLHPNRNLDDDVVIETVQNAAGEDVQVETITLTKEDKCYTVDLFLDQIANFAPLIPRNDIIRDSGSIQEVWQKIRLYYNLEKSGALMNECWSIKKRPDESPQALYARLKQCYDDNLLCANGLDYVDGPLTEDEELTPTLHNSIILHWLQLLHPQLRDAVTTRFSTQLRNKTYAALFPEISRSVNSLLEELNGESSANRVFANQNQRRSSYQRQPSYPSTSRSYTRKNCEYCKLTGKRAFHTHSIEDCLFIKRENRKASSANKQVECDEVDLLQEHYDEYLSLNEEPTVDHDAQRIVEHVIDIHKININASPVLILSKDNVSYPFVLDTGCTGNVIDEATAKRLKASIKPTFQRARTADGKLMNIIGEVSVTLFRKEKSYSLDALVCADKTDLLAGMPFMKANDVAVRPATDEIIIDGKEFLKYDPVRNHKVSKAYQVITNFTIQSSSKNIILPGEKGYFPVNKALNNQSIVIEPRWDSQCNTSASKDSQLWPPPQIVTVNNNQICLKNSTKDPVIVKRSEQFCQYQPAIAKVVNTDVQGNEPSISVPFKTLQNSEHLCIQTNPANILSQYHELEFKNITKTYNSVFTPVTSPYNGKYGACFVEVNLGKSMPPQHKGRVPFYGRDNLQQLQEKFDELESKGVFSRPQDIDITVENINPSFLVNKQNSNDKRLVTDFSSIAEYCRPTPTLLPNIDTTLRTIGSWKYIVKTDMSSAYHQIPLKKSSKKFCGVHTPYKGLRVYNVGCMGLPGVEVALEELTCLLLGDMVQENKVAKTADDLFIGGQTPEELLLNFERVLDRFHKANIKLSPSKTVIAPKSIMILGWVWTSGSLKASPHRINALSTCPQPETASALKSYIGAYRFLSKVLPRYANALAPLEEAIKGKSGNEKIQWSSSLSNTFKRAQESLSNAKTLTVPIPSDTLWIVTDAAVRPSAVGATLYTVREGKPLLAGFFNAKLPEFQSRWLPCEMEALGIAMALNHYAPLIIESEEKPIILTDSKPCIQAVSKLRRGEFSTSARMTTFLSNVSRYSAEIQHIAGRVNLPSDYASRHPLDCTNPNICQICKFSNESSTLSVYEINIKNILDGEASLPYTNRESWKLIQTECPNLRKVSAHIKNGTIPHRKNRNLRTVRKYLSSNIVVSHDGLLVRRIVKPLICYDQIVVPEDVANGLLTALHLTLQHPTAFQLKKVFSRYFFTLKLDTAIQQVSQGCHQCASIKDIPKSLIEQSTSEPPDAVGHSYSADIIKRCKQKILIIRETTTSYTLAELIPSEKASDVSAAIIRLCNILRPSKSSSIVIKLDPASGNKSMALKCTTNHHDLARNNIRIELGRSKNVNKNPISDKAIRELHREILNVKPSGGSISSNQLSEAVANLNSRLRSCGLSAFEQWTQRDQVTGDQLPFNDKNLIMQQYERRLKNHPSSEISKAGNKKPLPAPQINVGSLVYIYGDRDKTKARQRYIITDIDKDFYTLRKFTATLFSKQTYKVKPNEIYIVPDYFSGRNLPPMPSDESDSEEDLEESNTSDTSLTESDNDGDSDSSSQDGHATPPNNGPGIKERLRRRNRVDYRKYF